MGLSNIMWRVFRRTIRSIRYVGSICTNPRLEFPHRAGRCRLGDRRFCPRFVGVIDEGRISDPEMGPYPPRVALGLQTPG